MSIPELIEQLRMYAKLGRSASQLGSGIPDLYELLTAPANKILKRWFGISSSHYEILIHLIQNLNLFYPH